MYGNRNVTITNSNFTDTSAGYVIVGLQNVNITGCMFSNNTQSNSVIYINSQYSGDFGIYITDSKFYNCSRPIYSQANVTVNNSHFFDVTASEGGGVIYSSKSVTLTNCIIVNSTAIRGNGGAVYSEGLISIFNSLLINNSAMAANSGGGSLYSSQSVTIANCSIINSYTTAYGGAIYGREVTISDSILRESVAIEDGGAVYSIVTIDVVNSRFRDCSVSTGNGGAIYSGSHTTAVNSNISDCSALYGKGGAIFSRARSASRWVIVTLCNSNFSNNSATSGGVLYADGPYHYHMQFSDSMFMSNEALGSITGGGVAYIGNTTLSITNSVFRDNIAAGADGGVLDLSFSSVSVEHSLFIENEATNNGSGGVFFGRKYTTNFTVTDTYFTNNSAGNGGVFYVRRFNSHVNIRESTFLENTADYKGGVMDLGGVTLTMDMDTVIANNTAGSSGNVISACVSQITAYGLEARLDPIYPLYCSIYDEGNGFNPKSHSITTDASITVTAIGSTIEYVQPTTHHEDIHTGSLATTTASTDMSSTMAASDPSTPTTNSPSNTTSQPTTIKDTTTTTKTESNPQFTDSPIVTIGPQSNVDKVTPTSEESTSTPAAMYTYTVTVPTARTMNSSTISSADSSHEGSTTSATQRSGSTIAADKITTQPETDNWAKNLVTETASSPSSTLSKLQAAEQDNTLQNASQHGLLQVAISSLVVLAMVCITVCAIMVTVFIMACKRNTAQFTHSRGRYKKLPQAAEALSETQETQEYSFVEI